MRVKSFVIVQFFLFGCASSHKTTGSVEFSWPVKRATLTRSFKSKSKRHDGVDLAAPKNTPVYAAEGGRVLYVGREFSGYGKLVIIEHRGDRWASFYGHLNRFQVSEGDYVKRGQLIGRVGKTGRASGYHLHFEIRHNLKPVNPLPLLPNKALMSRR